MAEEELYGRLFNTIPLLSEEHLNAILNSMDKEHAIYYLTQAVNYAYLNGVFALGESEVISKSIRILNAQDSKETHPKT